jgi:predicted nucleic acid-binding protein
VNPVVIDASVILRWAFDDEADRDGAVAVAEALQAGSLVAIAPPNFLLEVAASLVFALRVGRIARHTVDTVMRALTAIAIDETDPHRFAEAALEVALRTGVRVPDAAYLETARRVRSPLITADRAQLEGALRMGLAVIPLNEVPAREPLT